MLWTIVRPREGGHGISDWHLYISNTLGGGGSGDNSRSLGSVGIGLSHGLHPHSLIDNDDFSLYLELYVAGRSTPYKIVRVDTGKVANAEGWQELKLSDYVIDRDCELEVFVEHTGNGEVWFDDLTVEIERLVAGQENHYYPFGMEMQGISTRGNPHHKYTYNGKEKQEEFSLNWHDYGFRNYDAQLGRWHGVDPMAAVYLSTSPYVYALNNPLRYIDPDGRLVYDWESGTYRDDDGNEVSNEEAASQLQGQGEVIYSAGGGPEDWVEKSDGTIVWDDAVTSADDADLQAGDKYLGKAVAVFEGSSDEKLGEGNNLFGKGAKLAKATVYGPGGAGDIKEYGAYTMSSDPLKYGTLADGEYTVYYDKVGKSGFLKSNWAVEGRGKVPARNGVNPAYPSRNPGYLEGVFIHRSNNDGYAGGEVSRGCLLICPSYNNSDNGWDEFNKQLQGAPQFKMILKRD